MRRPNPQEKECFQGNHFKLLCRTSFDPTQFFEEYVEKNDSQTQHLGTFLTQVKKLASTAYCRGRVVNASDLFPSRWQLCGFESHSWLYYFIIETESYSFICYNTEAGHLHLVNSQSCKLCGSVSSLIRAISVPASGRTKSLILSD